MQQKHVQLQWDDSISGFEHMIVVAMSFSFWYLYIVIFIVQVFMFYIMYMIEVLKICFNCVPLYFWVYLSYFLHSNNEEWNSFLVCRFHRHMWVFGIKSYIIHSQSKISECCATYNYVAIFIMYSVYSNDVRSLEHVKIK